MSEMDKKLHIDQGFDLYQSRLRILLILYFFSTPYSDPSGRGRKRVFKTELRIQKIDFLLRNPDYLAYEILSLLKEGEISNSSKVKRTVKKIFKDNEPVLRKTEMERFFFGAYEDLDDIVAFLTAYGLIEFESELNTAGQVFGKKYYITDVSEARIEKGIVEVPSITWYATRCKLILEYFGSLSGSELKTRQYQIEAYRKTPLKEFIAGISKETTAMFFEIFAEELV